MDRPVEGNIHVEGADEVYFLITADTDYQINFDPDFKDPKTYVGVDPLRTTREWMKQAASLSYAELLGEHYTDYAALFGRTQLELNPDQKGGMTLPTPPQTGTLPYGSSRLFTGVALLSVRTLPADSQFTAGKSSCQPARYVA